MFSSLYYISEFIFYFFTSYLKRICTHFIRIGCVLREDTGSTKDQHFGEISKRNLELSRRSTGLLQRR